MFASVKQLFTWLLIQVVAIVVSSIVSWFLVNPIVDIFEILYYDRMGTKGDFSSVAVLGLLISTVVIFLLINSLVIKKFYPNVHNFIVTKFENKVNNFFKED